MGQNGYGYVIVVVSIWSKCYFHIDIWVESIATKTERESNAG